MPDALTESYCERCGTRYEFAAPAKMTTTRRARGLISGFKNYVMSQDSLSDSLNDAIRSQEEVLAARQLDAFHSSFNFCIDCRQYTCTNCWNDSAGRCQSCQPLPASQALAERFAATLGAVEPEYAMQFPLNDKAAWPELDLSEQAPAPAWPTAATAPIGAEAELEPVWVPEPEPEPVVAEAEPAWVPEPEPVQAAPAAEPEPVVVEAEAEPPVEAEPVWIPEPVQAAPVVEPEPVVAPEPVWVPEEEPVLVEAEAVPNIEPEPEPEPIPVEAEAEPEPEQLPYRPLRPISGTFLHFPGAAKGEEVPAVAASAADQEVPAVAASAADQDTLAARRAQLDLLGLGDTGQGPVAPERVVLPYRSSGAAVRPTAAGGTTPLVAGVAFWDASAREVAGAISQIGVRSCGHCELSLSASARFCRRCGTPQSQSA